MAANSKYISGGLFKVYLERRSRKAADYLAIADAEFGAGHLQYAISPDTVILLNYPLSYQLLL